MYRSFRTFFSDQMIRFWQNVEMLMRRQGKEAKGIPKKRTVWHTNETTIT